MTLHRYVRIAISLAVAGLAFWGCNGMLYLFNHPKFPGEATAAVIGLLLLTLLFAWSCIVLVRWCFATPPKSSELSEGEK